VSGQDGCLDYSQRGDRGASLSGRGRAMGLYLEEACKLE